MSSPADLALAHLKRLLGDDPLLRDVLAQAVPSMQSDGGFRPAVDVFDMEDHHIVLVDVPGVPAADLRVRLHGARLVIEGARAADAPEGGRPRTRERGHGSFQRSFLLPEDVDGAAVHASLNAGRLRVTVPRKGASETPRDVPIDITEI